ncbi:eukaryotic translation initiation factor 4 gamma 3-like isoform X4 [Ostrinia furnacalis]|uniref:eukaryotic translation initiation factor 4 gamma 3-like isoform X4 n=1 Tax=Ostrinia furnacalis TaxID=93504 RepID=UPI00103C80CA|nr:eukaryotic translation initiation factor 4 gamma 3-like isoform X4 [Ostrinia furnacalis]
MSGNGNQVPLAPSQRGPGPYPRASTPHRPVDCYHPSGASGAAYMATAAGGAQASGQASLRVQPTPQPSAPPAPQQDMKTTMAGHSYVAQQNQTPQARPQQQYQNFQYRATQHGARPNTHPRQQQPYIPGTAATATGPVMYHPIVFQPTHMGMQTYQQPRSSTPGYYPYMAPYISYSNPPSHSSPYYFTSNNQPLPTPNLQTNAPGGRSNPTTMVGPQGTPATPTAPTASLAHSQGPAHMHQTIPGIRQPLQPTKRPSYRVPIINPLTKQDIFSEIVSNENQYLSGDSSGRQTPQQEHPQQPTHSVAEEFTRMVNEVANQPTSSESAAKSSKIPDVPASTCTLNSQPQTNAITTLNSNIGKSDILSNNENKNLGPDIAVEPIETPVVSAISDSPVIVPKMPKQLQKNSDQIVQPLVVDTNKNLPANKQHKTHKSKPLVPQVEDVDKSADNSSTVVAPQEVAAAPAPQAPAEPAPAAAPAPPAHVVPPSVVPNPSTVQLPQRVRDNRQRLKSSEEKEKLKDKDLTQDKETPPTSNKPNGPTHPVVTSSVDSLQEVIIPPTSQSSQAISAEPAKKYPNKHFSTPLETENPLFNEKKVETVKKSEHNPSEPSGPTATELLSASIEKVAKESAAAEAVTEPRDSLICAIEAQAKLTQSLASCLRTNQTESKMKDINLNNKTTDPDTANGNTDVTKTETAKEDFNKNEKVVKNTKNNNKKSGNKMANNDNLKELETYENGKDETDKVSAIDQENALPNKDEILPAAPEEAETAPPVFVPKYKYNDDQWSPVNKTGKKCYDLGLLKQIKDDPLSKNKPNVPLLEACNIIRSAPIQDQLSFSISRPMNDSLFPSFAKGPGMGPRSNTPRDPKKDGRNMAPSGKGSIKMTPTPSGSNSQKMVFVSLSLREEVKLNQVDSAWKPSRFRKESVTEEEFKTQELYKKFRGILNKLTPQKFDTLLDRVKTLEINNQKRLEGVIDLVFEKAIDEPNFSEAYAAMCNKLSTLKVPADNAANPEQCVNFRALIISKCQNQFETDKVDEQVLKLEKELAECTDPAKKKELQLMLNEENRRVRMRSVGNVRFIGELYKLKMLTAKIMVYCMNNLIEKLEEEKLECLCKLLTTIGEQVESEVREQLDNVFKKMQYIVDRKSNKISSRVRFMIQDVVELRKRKWVVKSVVDSQPKMMDQIQKEAEQQQRHIEIMNASPMGGFRGGRDDGGRGKRGEGSRRQGGGNSFMESNNWKTPRNSYTVDTSKLKAAGAANPKNLSTIKLAPPTPSWSQGSGTKSTAQAGSNSMISLTKNNMYSMLENVQTDPTSLRVSNVFLGNKEMSPSYHSKGASIERSTFPRGIGVDSSGSRSGSIGLARSNSGSRSTSAAPPTPPASEPATPQPAAVAQEPLPEAKKKSVKSMIDLCLINRDDEEMVADTKQLFPQQYHAAVVTEILNVALEKTLKEVVILAKSLLHLVSSNTILPEHFVSGIKEIFEFAPDLYIDIPMLYEYLGKFIAPQIEKKHITFKQTFVASQGIIAANQGHLFLKAVIKDLKESMGPTFVKSKWQESELELKQWMNEDMVTKWIEENNFEFLEGDAKPSDETKKILTPAETQMKLLQLMNSDESCDCIKGWVQDNLGKSSNEDWFMRALIQAICEHALFGAGEPHFNPERMSKYAGLINDFGESKQAREASCLFGIQQLIHRLEHPQGLTLDIFQYLHEQYMITVDGFIAWEESEMEPEGKGVMLKALTSFFTNIKEADNEDSCSED